MPDTRISEDIELIIENVGGGGGGPKPPFDQGGGEESGGKRRLPGPASARRYYTGIAVAIVSILMFFMALVSAYVVRKGSSTDWNSFRFPPIVWLNTAILLSSSLSMEVARRCLAAPRVAAFKRWWSITTILGVFFLAGQLLVWRELVVQGVYMASNPASSFFYVFTGAHAVHVVGGVGALLFVWFRNFERAKVSRLTAVEVTSYFWHFLDGLWVFLAVLLYLGR
jgi:cytochrome c oxidase subunit 3